VRFASLIAAIALAALLSSPALGITDKEVIALKKAGVGDALMGLIVKEKVLETCAFTVDEIIAMKKAGIGDETLGLIIREGSFLKGEDEIVYGRATRPLKASTIDDILHLKRSGISDDLIRAIIVFHSGSSSEADRLKAWEMLKSMGMIIPESKEK
jgi:hypothetical protein